MPKKRQVIEETADQKEEVVSGVERTEPTAREELNMLSWGQAVVVAGGFGVGVVALFVTANQVAVTDGINVQSLAGLGGLLLFIGFLYFTDRL